MKLEVICRTPSERAARPHNLLFVHGAYGAAWVWDQHFLPYFAEKGYAAYAVSLRGHGGSDGKENLSCTRLRDYIADVESVIATLDAPPVLIGHSMGGMVVQKIIQERRLPGAVLMASVPPYGLAGTMFGMALSDPGLFYEMWMMQAMGPWVANGQGVRRALFSADTPEHLIQAVVPRLQPESMLVILDLMGLDLPSTREKTRTPVLVMGAEDDSFVSTTALRMTAQALDAELTIFPRMAHAMMLEPNWEQVAGDLCKWLDTLETGLSAVAVASGRPDAESVSTAAARRNAIA